MYIPLRCKKCKRQAPVLYEFLYNIWKEGLKKSLKKSSKKPKLVAEIVCVCGTTNRYDSPMMLYVFSLVFDEFSNKTAD